MATGNELVNLEVLQDIFDECVRNDDYNPEAKTSTMTKVVGKDSNGKLWTEPVEQAEVVSATESWLGSHVDPQTGYVVDNSLSISGAAADAKVAGDEINDLKSQINDIETTVVGTQTNAGGYTYPLPFKVGKTYYLTNTAASGTMNFNTYGNGAVIEQIKTSVQPNETVVFSPTLNADELRVYYTAANGSFKAEFGEVPEIWTKITEIESSIVDVRNDINDVDGDLNKVKNQLSDIAIWMTGSQTNAGGYSYNLPFTVGNTYKLTNTAASGTVNFNTYDNGAVVEEIKTSVQPGETVVFSPTINASQLRVYFPSANGSFKVVYGNFPNAEAETKKIPALETGLSDIESAFDASKYTIEEEFESGRYTASATVGQTYNPSKTSDSGWECIKLAVKPYDTITLYGAGTDGTLLWVLTDSSYVVLQKVSGAVTVTSSNPVKLTIAENGYLFMSSVKTNSHKCIHKLGNGFDRILDQEIKFDKDVFPLEFDFDVSKIPVQSDFSITSHDPQDIYDLYDGLMASYPQYITRVDCSEADSVLGVTRPSYLDGLPIYLYKFTPNIINTQVSIKRKVKIMVLTGVHSNEKWNIYNVYRILKYICENWATDKNAATIRTLVEFWIIPVVNPWGFVNVDTIQYAGRVNGNGVNLNRNAPASNWQLTSTGPDYSGPSAGSEYETKIWLYYHDLFKPDVFIDQHTPGMPETGIFGVLETDITKEYLANAGDVICREISNHLIINDANTPNSADACLFDMFSDTNYGAVTLCAREYGTPYSFLFEMSDSSKWDDGILTDHTVTSASSGVQIRLQMQNIYGAWQRLLYYASHDYLH